MNIDVSLLTEPSSYAAEAYRMLRTNVEYSIVDQAHKVIVVTSSMKMEGKTTVTSNLAVALAAAGHKVVLLDCDLRRPKQHEVFSVDNSKGVSTIVVRQMEVEKAHYQIDDAYGLSLITAGNLVPMPSEVIGSRRMDQLIRELKKEYEYVIIDTPPVLAAPETALISGKVDGVLLVVRAGKTKKRDVKRSLEAINKVNGNIIGIVFTQVNMSNYSFDLY